MEKIHQESYDELIGAFTIILTALQGKVNRLQQNISRLRAELADVYVISEERTDPIDQDSEIVK